MHKTIQEFAALARAASKSTEAIACDTCPVKDIAFCSVLPREQRKLVAASQHVRQVSKGEVLTMEGDRLSQIASVTKGVVKMTKSLSDGREQIVGLAFASDLVGRPFAHDSSVRVEAATDVTLCSFDKPQFERLLAQHPNIESAVLKAKLNELDAAKDWMLLLGRKSAQERVATLLSMLAARQADEDRMAGQTITGVVIELPLSRKEIASYLGLTLETVSREFSKLRKAGIIDVSGVHTISIPRVDRLDALTGA